MQDAPFHNDLAQGPEGGSAHWLEASDGVRLRMVWWPRENAKGTVLIFPGRTEYAEKYGRTAHDLHERGYACVSIDWRGQGLADRLLPDVRTGHVMDFTDYQRDLSAVLEALQELDAPAPRFLLAHSMGGCIGLRAVMDGLDVRACAFTGPMWGIKIAAALRPAAWALSWGSGYVGMAHTYAPGTKPEPLVQVEPFETNTLTGDRESYEWMQAHLDKVPEWGLGGPSLRWLNTALRECRSLAQRPSPNVPCLTFLGTDEDIVDTTRIHNRMNAWPNGTLRMIEGGRHEVLMETPAVRARIADELDVFFARHMNAPERSALSA